MANEPKVYLFWDNSNIFIGTKFVANRREGMMSEANCRVQFDAIHKLAVAGRPIGGGVCVGSVPPEIRVVWDKLKQTGVILELYERGADTGREQGIDQCLQVHMLRAALDEAQPQIAVLLTGDGAGYEDGVGFHADLERLHSRGWGIEVISWDKACRKTLKQWAENVGVYIKLEDYYDSVTFVEGGRRVKPLSLVHRAKARPRVGVASSSATTGR